jgi:hypothetical protein
MEIARAMIVLRISLQISLYTKRMLMTEHYEIRIMGRLNPHWSEWFSGLALTYVEENETLLTGLLPDQAALHSLLERIRDLNLTLISINCSKPTDSPLNERKGDQNE